MKHIVWFLLRHDWLPRGAWARRWALRAIFKPVETRDYDLIGWYDLGPEPSPAMFERIKEWHDTETSDG